MDRQARALIGAAFDLVARGHIAIDAVLGAEQRGQVDPGGGAQHLDGGLQVAIDARRIGDQPDAFAAHRLESAPGQHLIAELNFGKNKRRQAERQMEQQAKQVFHAARVAAADASAKSDVAGENREKAPSSREAPNTKLQAQKRLTAPYADFWPARQGKKIAH